MHLRIDWILAIWLSALIGVTVVAPNVWIGGSWHDQERVFQAVLMFASLLLWARLPLTDGWRKNMPAQMLAGVFLLGMMAVLRALIPLPWAALEWSWWLALWALLESTAAVALRAGRQATLNTAGALLAGFSLVYGLKLLMGLLATYLQDIPLNSRELIDGFSNSRFFGQYATLVWPLLVALSADVSRPRGWRIAMGLASSLLMLAILVSQTRGTFYGLASGLLLAALVRVGQRWWVATATAGLAGGALFAGLILIPGWLGWVDVSRMELRFQDFGLSGREQLWSRAFALIRQHPWLGVGPMGFVLQFSRWGAHPHSSVIQVAVEWGIPAVILLLVIVLKAMATLAREVHARRTDLWGAGLLVALTGSLTQSLVDGVLVMPLSQTGLMCCAGLAVAWVQSAKPRAQSHGAATPRWRQGLALAVSLLLGSSLVHAMTAPGNGLRDQDACVSRAPGPLKPRFWACGWVENKAADRRP